MPYNPSTSSIKPKIVDENLPEKDLSSISSSNNSNNLNKNTELLSQHQTSLDSYFINSTNLVRNQTVNSTIATNVLNTRSQFHNANLPNSTDYYGMSSNYTPIQNNNKFANNQPLYMSQSQLPSHYMAHDTRLLTNSLSSLDINQRTNIGMIPTDYTPIQNMYTPALNHMQYRQNTEVERMKMKLYALEQQVFLSQNSSRTLPTGTPITTNNRLNELEYNTALLRTELASNEAKEAQLLKLENTLNEREYEISELKKKFTNESNKFDKELTKYKNMLKTKDDDVLSEKTKIMNLQKEFDKTKSKLDECNDYIAKLPTPDEIDENKKKFGQLFRENEQLLGKLNDSEKKITKAKVFIKEKNAELKDIQEKLENTEMDKEKNKLEFENYKKATQSVGEMIERCEENSRLKAELDCAKKLLTSMQEKVKTMNAKHENELNELNEKIKLENDAIESLRNDLERKEQNNDKLEKTIKEISQKNQSLLSEKLNLSEKLKSLEVLVGPDSLKLLQMLFGEMNSCSTDLESLVSNCIDIYKGRNVDVCSLLGVSNSSVRNESIELSNNELIDNLTNKDYLIRKTNELKELKKKITEIRKMVSDEYADKIGSNISCIMQ